MACLEYVDMLACCDLVNTVASLLKELGVGCPTYHGRGSDPYVQLGDWCPSGLVAAYRGVGLG